MAAGTSPIYTRTPDVQWIGAVSAANTTKDLTSGTTYLVWTADTAEGGRLEKLKIRPLGTNVATVIRVWINNGGATGTASNNILFYEYTLVATTVSEVAAQADIELALGISLDPIYRVYVTLGTVVAAGFAVTGVGGKY